MADLIERQGAIDALNGNVRVMGRETAQAVMEYIRECAGRICSLPSAQVEPTFEQVKEYCKKRSLTIITNDLYHGLITEYSAPPERLTDDDFETIRIHLNAYKEGLWNQGRLEEAEDYQRIIDRFMSFASAQPERMIDRAELFNRLAGVKTLEEAFAIIQNM